MIFNNLSSSPQSDRYSQHEYTQNHPINGSHLIELKSFSDNFQIDGK